MTDRKAEVRKIVEEGFREPMSDIGAGLSELLPCPLCGNADRPFVTDFDGEPLVLGYIVRCNASGWDGDPTKGCGCSTGWCETPEQAIAAWNRRSGNGGDVATHRHPLPPVDGEATLPERDATRPAEQQGLFRKFDIRRVDGSDAPGGKHHGCRYFVLDVEHDPHSVPALIAYAAACEATHPQLAKDLRSEWQVPPLPDKAKWADVQRAYYILCSGKPPHSARESNARRALRQALASQEAGE